MQGPLQTAGRSKADTERMHKLDVFQKAAEAPSREAPACGAQCCVSPGRRPSGEAERRLHAYQARPPASTEPCFPISSFQRPHAALRSMGPGTPLEPTCPRSPTAGGGEGDSDRCRQRCPGTTHSSTRVTEGGVHRSWTVTAALQAGLGGGTPGKKRTYTQMWLRDIRMLQGVNF
ncbi:hypothetical protein AAY473_011263 [Plecturocebus cupreus]